MLIVLSESQNSLWNEHFPNKHNNLEIKIASFLLEMLEMAKSFLFLGLILFQMIQMKIGVYKAMMVSDFHRLLR